MNFFHFLVLFQSVTPYNKIIIPINKNSKNILFQTKVNRSTKQVQSHQYFQTREKLSLKACLKLKSSLRSGDEYDERMQKKIQGRKKRVFAGYVLTQFYFLFESIFILSKLITKKNSDYLYLASGPFMVSTLAYILQGAAKNNRLSSNTYKRLNLFLALHGFLGLVSTAILSKSTASIHSHISLRAIPFFITLVNSIKGWGYGVKDWNLRKSGVIFIDDFIKGCKETLKICFTFSESIRSFGYFFMTTHAGILKLFTSLEFIQICLSQTGSFISPITSNLFLQYSHLTLLTAISLTLKDAADRKRLNGTTFIQLNYLAALIWMCMSVSFSLPKKFFMSIFGLIVALKKEKLVLHQVIIPAVATICGIFAAGNGFWSSIAKQSS